MLPVYDGSSTQTEVPRVFVKSHVISSVMIKQTTKHTKFAPNLCVYTPDNSAKGWSTGCHGKGWSLVGGVM